jgi:hypothetical protein
MGVAIAIVIIVAGIITLIDARVGIIINKA